ncbi:MAG: hypothetical protein HY735_34750 [Verrucomicrobia bacterium]|nr:hypothetical protein [Verrucomicrobiota bacterium]
MLTAWDKSGDRQVVLPDFEERGDDAWVREHTRQGQIVCPTCQQALWLHAGTLRTWHFAHRSLSDCPHGRVSEGILSGRRLLYLFFQSRIAGGKLRGEVKLEPPVKGLPDDLQVDLLVKREGKPPVSVLLLESSLKPHTRSWLPFELEKRGFVFRPVFLATRLKKPEDVEDEFLLDTAQRAFQIATAYDEAWRGYACGQGTLHFIDGQTERWTTLRGLQFVHSPQVYRAGKVLSSAMASLLWSETHTDWVHEGEAEKLKQLHEQRREQQRREQQRREQHRREEQRRERELEKARRRQETLPPPPPKTTPIRHQGLGSADLQVSPTKLAVPMDSQSGVEALPKRTPPPPPPEPAPEPEEPWLREGLLCIGCGQRTTNWQNAQPGAGKCICKDCFAIGVRLK